MQTLSDRTLSDQHVIARGGRREEGGGQVVLDFKYFYETKPYDYFIVILNMKWSAKQKVTPPPGFHQRKYGIQKKGINCLRC